MRFLDWVKTASSAGLSITTSLSSFLSPCSSFGTLSRKTARLPVPSNLPIRPALLRWQRDLTMLAASGSNDDEGQSLEPNDTEAVPPPLSPSDLAMIASNDDDAAQPASPPPSEALTEKELKKQRKKEAKRAKRAKREGKDLSLKPCDLCHRDRDLLIRCQIDTSLNWFMVCGKCWKDVSGGVADGDAAHPHYRYGGLWKAR